MVVSVTVNGLRAGDRDGADESRKSRSMGVEGKGPRGGGFAGPAAWAERGLAGLAGGVGGEGFAGPKAGSGRRRGRAGVGVKGG